jgi:hypothetical protein
MDGVPIAGSTEWWVVKIPLAIIAVVMIFNWIRGFLIRRAAKKHLQQLYREADEAEARAGTTPPGPRIGR